MSANGRQFSDSWSQPPWGALGFSHAKALSIVALAAAIETGTFDAELEERDDPRQGGVVACGPTSAKLHYKGKSYSFKGGTCGWPSSCERRSVSTSLPSTPPRPE